MVAGTFHIRRISIYITWRDAVIPALNGTDYERRWMAYHYKQRATLLTDDESKALAFVCGYSSSFSEPSTLDGDEWLQSRSALLFDMTPRHRVISFATFRDSVVVSFARVECPTSSTFTRWWGAIPRNNRDFQLRNFESLKTGQRPLSAALRLEEVPNHLE